MKKDKQWSKPNVKPEVGRIINRIAADKDVYVYELIEEVFRKEFPTYFN
jgi:hypothetical protein